MIKINLLIIFYHQLLPLDLTESSPNMKYYHLEKPSYQLTLEIQ